MSAEIADLAATHASFTAAAGIARAANQQLVNQQAIQQLGQVLAAH